MRVSVEFMRGNFDRLQRRQLLLLAEFNNRFAHFALWKSREAVDRNSEDQSCLLGLGA